MAQSRHLRSLFALIAAPRKNFWMEKGITGDAEYLTLRFFAADKCKRRERRERAMTRFSARSIVVTP
jgi:O-phosphoseryl-tRNA(Cys) synthetase